MTHRLLVNPGTPQAWEIQLKSGANRIGRREANDFQVPHVSVSGTHCEIMVSSAGAILKDLGSTNGTFVNGVPVHEAILQSGQHVQLGSVDMVFESAPISGVARAASAAPPLPPPVTARATGLAILRTAAPAAHAAAAVPVEQNRRARTPGCGPGRRAIGGRGLQISREECSGMTPEDWLASTTCWRRRASMFRREVPRQSSSPRY